MSSAARSSAEASATASEASAPPSPASASNTSASSRRAANPSKEDIRLSWPASRRPVSRARSGSDQKRGSADSRRSASASVRLRSRSKEPPGFVQADTQLGENRLRVEMLYRHRAGSGSGGMNTQPRLTPGGCSAGPFAYETAPWQRLYFLSLPHGQGALRPTLACPAREGRMGRGAAAAGRRGLAALTWKR